MNQDDRLGPYRLLRRLGEGGMGVVHLAQDSQGRQVAVKVLRGDIAGDDVARRRLAREVETMRRVRSGYIAEVVDADVTGRRPYIVTQYVPGRPLDDVVKQDGPLEGEALVRLAAGIAKALAAVHEAGVVHRDLKPSNVMLVRGDPVLIDFGIAQAVDSTRLTQTGMFIGTPGYLAPEIIEGDATGPGADVHAWAGTVLFACTGKPPFGSGSLEMVFYNITTGRADVDSAPAPLRPLLRAAFARDPKDRPGAAFLAEQVARLSLGPSRPAGHPSEIPTEPRFSTGDLPHTGMISEVPPAPQAVPPPPRTLPPAVPGPAAARDDAEPYVSLLGDQGGRPVHAPDEQRLPAAEPEPEKPAVPPADDLWPTVRVTLDDVPTHRVDLDQIPTDPEAPPGQPGPTRAYTGVVRPEDLPAPPDRRDAWPDPARRESRADAPTVRHDPPAYPPPAYPQPQYPPPVPYTPPAAAAPQRQGRVYGKPRAASSGPHPVAAGYQSSVAGRSVVYRVVSGLLLTIMVGCAVLAPALVIIVAVPFALLLRAADAAHDELALARARSGGSAALDVFSVFGNPAALGKSAAVTAALLPYAIILGLPVTLLLTITLRDVPVVNALSWGAATFLWTMCAGPGVEGPKRQMERVLGALVPGRQASMALAWLLGVIAFFVALLALSTLRSGAAPVVWSPFDVSGLGTELQGLRDKAN
ncbi:serine/threonine-protein kinase [Bailinhaonella thermotolerans]|uniref:serine/threonine-protein kinase n=1 Tax=Bailinhaonella thermotolerans TaxID=1070861 RepID=UPI00192A6675|nr:serine/threonine-protein kinase [Bailinhaonella thermotolerans]